ncbi:MAG: hypothetical protein BWX57_00372 [Tenericutes bacterium ADurb.Bin024]|nr:MAG: hypothetical protein BWX57_00372 [Tenericutes bacterium ADurb.Bin024]
MDVVLDKGIVETVEELEENLAKYSELRLREFIREFSESIYAGEKLEVIEEYTKELARLRNRKN